MYKLFKIAKDNMKKQKGDMVTFLLLTLIASFLIFDGMSAVIGMNKVMDSKFDEIHGPHVILFNHDTEAEVKSAKKAFTENEHILEYEMTPAVTINCEYRNKKDTEFLQYKFIAESFNEEVKISDLAIPDKDLGKYDILLPLNMKGNFAEEDTIQLKLGDDIYDFKVAGYLEDPYFCSTMNLTIFSVNMSSEIIDVMAENHPTQVIKSNMHKGRIDDTEFDTYSTMDLEKDISDAYKEEIAVYSKMNPEENYTDYLLANWQMMRGGSQFLPQLTMILIIVFAVMIMIIAIVIISFSIKNFIQKNMKNTGILEASGYTVRELRTAMVIQVVLVAGIGSVLGVVLGILTFGGFGVVVTSLLGLSMDQPVNWFVAVASLILVTGMVAFAALIISRIYKKISVLDALRGGINAHNFRRNHFSFEKTPLPVSLILSLKDSVGNAGRNAIMVFIAAILAISTLIGFGMYDNFGKSPDVLVKMMGFEMPTATIVDDDNSSDYGKMVKGLKNLNGVEKVFAQTSFEPTAIAGDKEQTIFTYAVDDMDQTVNTSIIEGRAQETENEIMITLGVANDMGLKVGDVITVKFADEQADYLIVGINQRVERMGRTLYMTVEGADRLIPGDVSCQYYVYGKEGISFSDIESEVKLFAEEEDLSLTLTDSQKMMEGTLNSLVIAMKMLCIIILVITLLVVVFVESLVIRAKISREWRGMGISKAMGQTSRELIVQIMLSNIPAILAGTLIGVLFAEAAGSGIIKTAFSLFAVKSIPFNISFIYMIITILGIITIAILTSGFAGLKVNGLKPVEMITED